MNKTEFMIGCNYWASNAGTEMWRNFEPATIEMDLKVLSENGIKYLRVFPNWRDFQPVEALYTANGKLKEYRLVGDRFSENDYFLDEQMMDKFGKFCDICDQYQMKLIVGLLTGWMSGRLFIPYLLHDKNLFTDATAILFEQRFIKGFVSKFKERNAVFAWDLGNECNCMSKAENRVEAAAWTLIICNAIRASDNTRPIFSGMHGLGETDSVWSIFDQAEGTDVLTTHPYPQFVKHCYFDDLLSIRTLMHASCQTKYYAGLSKKPCLTEEIGTLGPMTCDGEIAEKFLWLNLMSNWANGSIGVLWWCACEQVKLNTPPYSWNMMERELGLIDINNKPKLELLAYKRFSEMIKEFDLSLPSAQSDAVCITSKWQDSWGAAYVSYILAKQAGLNIEFCYSNQEFTDSEIYILPSICNAEPMPLENFEKLKQKVAKGATLYISNNDGYLAEFANLTGLRIKHSTKNCRGSIMDFGKESIGFKRTKLHITESIGAEVLAYDDCGYPALSKYKYGDGCVYYLNFPLETMLLDENNAFDSNKHMIYRSVFNEKIEANEIICDNSYIGVTLHKDEKNIYVVLINYSNTVQKLNLKIKNGIRIEKIYRGNTEIIPPCEAVIFTLTKK